MPALPFRSTVAAAIVALALSAPPARAEDYSDIWWAGQSEDGWGVTFVQSDDVIFATLFVHGPAPSTTEFWYVAALTRTGTGTFTGDLYQTTGTGIGAVWNPAQHTATKVGTATFSPSSTTSGTLAYNVTTTNVTKSIVRQTLKPIKLGGTYYGTGVVDSTNCSTPSNNGRSYFDVDPVVSHTTSQLQLTMTFGSETCTFTGAYAQQGLLFRIPSAAYVCRNGAVTTVDTTATVYEIKSTAIGLEGRWTASNVAGCHEDGTFASVFP
jgi:hypothetical protein